MPETITHNKVLKGCLLRPLRGAEPVMGFGQ